jgi:hypothetical protein
MVDVEIRIDDPQEAWDALYRRIAELGERGDVADPLRSAGPRADGLSEAESFLLAMWGFV